MLVGYNLGSTGTSFLEGYPFGHGRDTDTDTDTPHGMSNIIVIKKTLDTARTRGEDTAGLKLKNMGANL